MRFRKSLILGLFVAAIGVGLRPTTLALRLEDEIGLRWLFSLRGPVAPPPDVAIVSIDKGAAQQLGMDPAEWPPPRHVHADVVRRLHRLGVSGIIIDIWFPTQRTPGDDDQLSAAMAESGNVVLVQNFERSRVPGAGVTIDELQSPISQFQKAAIDLAPFPLPRGSPTTVFWPFLRTANGLVPTLPAAALQAHGRPLLDRLLLFLSSVGVRNLDDLPRSITSSAQSREVLRVLRRELANDPGAAQAALDRLTVTTDISDADRMVLTAMVRLYAGRDAYYLNFYGPPGSIETIPFDRVLRADPGELPLSGKLVFVGESVSDLLTSMQQADGHVTVYSTSEGLDLSGTEIGATAFANLLTNRMLRPVSPLVTLLILAGFGGLVGFVTRLLPGTYATILAVALGLAWMLAAVALFTSRSIVMPLAVPLLVQLPIALFVGLLFRYWDIRRQTPIEVDPYARQQLFEGVCLTTDVKGYTTLAEHLTPDELHDLLDEYYDMLRKVVTRRRGLVWGRGGDSALCVWRAARRHWWDVVNRARRGATGQRHRLSACLAAVELRDAIEQFNARHPAAQQLPSRIGLDAGKIGLGPVGGELQAVGDPPNTATRIEALNEELSTRILASSRVTQNLDEIVTRPMGRFQLRGKSDSSEIVEIVGRRETVSPAERRLCERFAAAVQAYERGDWSQASVLIEEILLEWPDDGPAASYRRRLAKTSPGRK